MKREMDKNIFKILTSDPVSFNIWNLKSKLILVIHNTIDNNGWNQSEAASHLGITQPRVSNMLKGNLDKFSVDALLEMILKLGYELDTNLNINDESNPLNICVKKVVL
ncbi:helix-turn-helix domain-containing protein [Proteus terrae]|uniref:helix-turn-helix domain-containing protein n=1 Tax=Proteus terrae TaxID=1574161 RepID=UPI00288BF580|nr:helix-turn-helix transcriptional regulator [Proteus terrae]